MKDFKIIWSARSECGPNRKKNEDTIFPPVSGSSGPPFKAAVCDGLGGHVNGDIASKIAAETLSKKNTNLSQIISDANKNILDFQKENPSSQGMGTTMTAVSIDKDALMKIAHVGDSRCYVFSDRNLIKATEDQNVPGYQNVLKQALGSNEELKIQEVDFQLQIGDVVLLCSDGLYNEVGDEYIKKKMQDGTSADTFVGEILLLNPKDNVSGIVINLI
ncbi:protein phosphatase 2C domain-containing protein [Acidimicrobiaceae bacterium]|nr:protein phosphatase 2C domain-containing protein [Acidimicrobiaceae bacterium]